MEVQAKIDRTWDFCIAKYGLERLISLCLHGSQNYNLALPDSDADAKLIIAPTWDDIIHNRKPLSTTLAGPYGDINVTDIRLYIDVNLRKQNFNFLETLFTPYNCINPNYSALWMYLVDHKEAIAHYKPEEAVRTMMGQAYNQISRWGKFDNNKTLYNLLRIEYAISRYVSGMPFADTLAPKGEDHEFIMAVRLGKFGQEEMQKIFDRISKRVVELADGGQHVKSQEFVAETVLDNALDQFMRQALAWRFQN